MAVSAPLIQLMAALSAGPAATAAGSAQPGETAEARAGQGLDFLAPTITEAALWEATRNPAPASPSGHGATALAVAAAPPAPAPSAVPPPAPPSRLASLGLVMANLSAVAAAEAAAAASAEPGISEAPAVPAAPVPGNDPSAPLTGDADKAVLPGRRRPGDPPRRLPERVTQENPGAVRPPPPEAFPTDEFPVPDRWRILQTLGVVKENLLDPYHQNTLKGDRPIAEKTRRLLGLKAEDWFIALNATSDTVVEPRTFPIPNGIQFPTRPGSNDVFGKDTSLLLAQTFIFGASLIKGSTAFMPPEIEYRVALAYNANYVRVPQRRVLYVSPSKGKTRFDNFVGVQEAFIDYHLYNTSDRYDFYSVRGGIQPFQADFRGFLFNDNQLGVRLFGNRDNNRVQYNLAAFWRVEKDTNSGLNDLGQPLRKDFVFIGNLYRQDFPVPAVTSEVIVAYNRNREGEEIYSDKNGFPVRPALLGDLRGHNYDVVYLGYGIDGHFGRVNMTAFGYAALGRDSNNFFTSRPAQIRAFFAAAEPSIDLNWVRLRASALYASGDKKPFDNRETGFDAILENPIFAGADTSYWIRQTIPFAGGGRAIAISGRNGVLNSLRSSKDEGQSNFNNPGTMLLGVGGDFDLTPRFRLSANANHLWFANTQILKTLRSEGTIPKDIGWDLSLAAIWRPKMTQNIVFRLSGAVLQPGQGFKDLFANREQNKRYYSVLLNAILNY